MSKQTQTDILDELGSLISDLGRDGGKISPSIYDTAQRLRFYPPVEGVDPGLDWLLSQQLPDGGWCDPAVPAARDASTLAAVLALHHYRADGAARAAVQAGLAFLRRQAAQWSDIHLDGLPIAVEVVLPRLLREAQASGLDVDLEPYARLCALGRKKLDILERMDIRGGTAPTYSWEAFGTTATSDLLDRVDSVGHSPAATARWLQLARGNPALADAVARAEAYLDRAHAATDTDVPGVVPVVFPVKSFELCYGPYALLLTGILGNPSLQADLAPILDELKLMLVADNGVSFGDGFVPDVDDTSVAAAVLHSVGETVDPGYVMQFHRQDHFFTFAYELNPSVFSNAHAVHALALQNHRVPDVEKFLLQRQAKNAQWPPDKWHTCWRYTTLEVMTALAATGHKSAVRRALHALAHGQQRNGAWAHHGKPSQLDTVYTVLGLALGKRMGLLTPHGEVRLGRGLHCLQGWVDAGEQEERRWLSKEVYAPRRVDQAFRLAARLVLNQTHMQQRALVMA